MRKLILLFSSDEVTHPAQEERSFLQLLLREKETEKEEEDEEEDADEREQEAKSLRLKQKIDASLEQRAKGTINQLAKLVALIQQDRRRAEELTNVLKEKAGKSET